MLNQSTDSVNVVDCESSRLACVAAPVLNAIYEWDKEQNRTSRCTRFRTNYDLCDIWDVYQFDTNRSIVIGSEVPGRGPVPQTCSASHILDHKSTRERPEEQR